MKNIILIIFVAIAFIACESKEEKEFLRLVINSEPYDKPQYGGFAGDVWLDNRFDGYYFDDKGNIRYQSGVAFVFDKIETFEDSYKKAIYKSMRDRDKGAKYEVRIFRDRNNITKITIIDYIEGEREGEGMGPYILATISEMKEESQSTKNNNNKIRDLSKIKLVDFRVCSDRDVEKFIKSLDSLNKNEKDELAYMLFTYYSLISEREHMNRDRFMDYYREVKNKQTYKFD